MSSRGGNYRWDTDLVDHDLSRPHLIGIGGAGMRALARLAHQAGSVVSGSDLYPPAVDGLDEVAAVHVGHDPANLAADTTAVVVTSAIRPDNVELVEARRRGLPVVHRARALAQLVAGRHVIAVAGCHGKSSTTAMVTTILRSVGLTPGHMVGALPLGFSSADLGTGRLFVAEADESDRSFLAIRPALAVITNLENDHTEEYPTDAELLDAVAGWAAGADTLVVNVDDPGVRGLLDRLDGAGPRVITYGQSPEADWTIRAVSVTGPGSAVTVVSPFGRTVTVTVPVPAEHMAHNAVGALAASVALGVDVGEAAAALAGYAGLHRRLQVVEAGGVHLVDSHAHHPTAITADLAAARRLAGDDGRLVVVCEPVDWYRVRVHGGAIGAALAAADDVVLLPVHGRNTPPVDGVHRGLVAEPVRAAGTAVHEVDLVGAAAVVAGLIRPGDVVLTVGSDDVAAVHADLAGRLAGELLPA